MARSRGLFLAGLGLASAAGWVWLSRYFPATSSRRDVLTFLAVIAVLFLLTAAALPVARRMPRRAALLQILLFAALFRAVLLFAGLPPGEALKEDLAGQRVVWSRFLLYDDDLWRYLWDGYVVSAGLDPYARSPQAMRDRYDDGAATPAEEALLDGPRAFDVLDNVRFAGYRTVYPPLAQHLFWLTNRLAPGSVFAWKLLVALFDFGTCLLLARMLTHLSRGPEACVLYAWSPLAVKELAGSGHVDAVMIFFLVLAAERALAGWQRAGLAAYAASVLAKLGTLPLAPLFLRRARPRTWWMPVVVGAAIILPFWRGLPGLASALGAFGEDWTFNPGPWLLAARLSSESAAHLVMKALTLILVLIVTIRVRPSDDRHWILGIFVVLAGVVLLNAVVAPWYLLWALPFAVASGVRSWEVLTALSFLSYLVYAEHAEHAWWLWVEYGGFTVAAAVEWGRRRKLFNPPEP